MKVITLCIDQLIDTLPTRVKNTNSPLIIDLILSGGVFNGSYMLGSLLFLKEMEKRNYVKVNRISTCSISSLLGVLYITDKLYALCNNNYEVLFNQFIETQQMCCMLELRKYINIDPSDLFKINNKLYISYYNVRKQKKNTKCFFTPFLI
jgi:predicted acylesterase/phospholipase RssA